MQKHERDAYVQKFREHKVSKVITTNLLSRGLDIPQISVVINFDVPTETINNVRQGDGATYLHRIGRTGRFGAPGLALTIYDRDEDEKYMN